MAEPNLSELKGQLLLAAVVCVDGDTAKTFTSEELLVAVWKGHPQEWGLRGFEKMHPDSHRIDRELDSRGQGQRGLVALGMLERVHARMYRVTPTGLVMAARLNPTSDRVRERAGRKLEEEITRILEDEVFRAWLRDASQPTRFRDAGHFWSIAPGTPRSVIVERIRRIDQTLAAAADVLEAKGVNRIGQKGGILLFDAADVDRCKSFQETLKLRFARELGILGITAP
jgi:hypothetical protein